MPSRLSSLPLPALSFLLAAAVAACGSSGGSAAPSAAAPSEAASVAASEAPAAGGDAVAIKDFAFAPASLTVAAGSTVTWTNEDGAAHTATADDGSFDSGSLATGATFSQTFDTAGSFPYKCAIHPNMTGTIEVQ